MKCYKTSLAHPRLRAVLYHEGGVRRIRNLAFLLGRHPSLLGIFATMWDAVLRISGVAPQKPKTDAPRPVFPFTNTPKK